jgi:ribosomal protein S4E
MDAVPLASPSAVLPLPEITTPLSVGDWVEILTGSHRGCAGVVQSVEIGIDGEQSWVMVRLQGGPKVEVPRADVALIATDRN